MQLRTVSESIVPEESVLLFFGHVTAHPSQRWLRIPVLNTFLHDIRALPQGARDDSASERAAQPLAGSIPIIFFIQRVFDSASQRTWVETWRIYGAANAPARAAQPSWPFKSGLTGNRRSHRIASLTNIPA